MAKISVNGQSATKKRAIVDSDVVRTPEWLIRKMWDWVEERWINGKGKKACERYIDPCAGDGRIMRGLVESYQKYNNNYVGDIWEIEISKESGAYFPLPFGFTRLEQTDFFSLLPHSDRQSHWFDYCLMNPPFSGCQPYHFAKEIMDNWLAIDGAIIMLAPIYILTQNKARREWFSHRLSRLAFLPQQAFHPEVTVHAVLMQLEFNPIDGARVEFIEKEPK